MMLYMGLSFMIEARISLSMMRMSYMIGVRYVQSVMMMP